MSVSEGIRMGLKEMPSNAAWVASRATARGRKRRFAGGDGDRVRIDAAPAAGDSVDVRMRRAREAGESAREAEDQAVQAALAAKEYAEHARQVSEQGRARLSNVENETTRQLGQRVAAARKAADEAVERERQAAEEEAEEQR